MYSPYDWHIQALSGAVNIFKQLIKTCNMLWSCRYRMDRKNWSTREFTFSVAIALDSSKWLFTASFLSQASSSNMPCATLDRCKLYSVLFITNDNIKKPVTWFVLLSIDPSSNWLCLFYVLFLFLYRVYDVCKRPSYFPQCFEFISFCLCCFFLFLFSIMFWFHFFFFY